MKFIFQLLPRNEEFGRFFLTVALNLGYIVKIFVVLAEI